MQHDGKRVILRHRVRGSVSAVRTIRNTRVFETETRVVGNGIVKVRAIMMEPKVLSKVDWLHPFQ